MKKNNWVVNGLLLLFMITFLAWSDIQARWLMIVWFFVYVLKLISKKHIITIIKEYRHVSLFLFLAAHTLIIHVRLRDLGIDSDFFSFWLIYSETLLIEFVRWILAFLVGLTVAFLFCTLRELAHKNEIEKDKKYVALSIIYLVCYVLVTYNAVVFIQKDQEWPYDHENLILCENNIPCSCENEILQIHDQYIHVKWPQWYRAYPIQWNYINKSYITNKGTCEYSMSKRVLRRFLNKYINYFQGISDLIWRSVGGVFHTD